MSFPHKLILGLVLLSAGTLTLCTACGGSNPAAGGDTAQTDTSNDSNGEEDVQSDSNSVGDTVAEDTPTTTDRAGHVFFLGHSLLGWVAPEILEGFADAQSVEFSYEASIGIGANLQWQWQNPDTAEGEHSRNALGSRNYSTLVLTEAVPIEEQVMWAESSQNALNFANLAYGQNSDVQVYLYETWEHMDSGVDAWEQAVAEVRRHYGQILTEFNNGFAGRDARLIPGGAALRRLVQAVRAGEVPGIASYNELFVDNIHLTETGWYFIGCVFYATLYGASPEGVDIQPTDRSGGAIPLPPASAIPVMQRIAWEVVSSDPLSGR